MISRGAQKARQSPQFKAAEDRAKAYYENVVKNAAAGQGQQQANGKKGPEFSYFNQMKRKLILEWHKNKGRVFAFVTANFFFIIMAFQFFPVVWRGLVGGVKALTTSPSGHAKPPLSQQQLAAEDGEGSGDHVPRKRHKKRKVGNREEDLEDEEAVEMHRNRYIAEEKRRDMPRPSRPFSHLSEKLDGHGSSDGTKVAVPSPFTFSSATASSSLFDDTQTPPPTSSSTQQQFNQMHQGLFQNNAEYDGVKLGFETSFLVKMGDETEFTSSLEREHLTGNVSSH